MAPIQFLKFPLIIQRLIIRKLEISDVIELTMMSEKFKKQIQAIKLEVDKFICLLDTSPYQINIKSPLGSFAIEVIFRKSLNYLEWRKIDKSVVPIYKRNVFKRSTRTKACTLEHTEKSRLELLEKITRHLLSILKDKKYNLNYHGLKENSLIDLFIWKYVKQFDRIIIKHLYIICELTLDEIAFLFEKVATNHLYLHCVSKDDPNLKYLLPNPGPSRIQIVSIPNSSWLNLDNLLNMAEEYIICGIPDDPINKIQEVLKKWMSGTNEKLERLKLYTYEQVPLDQEEIFAGTNATPSVFTNDEIEKRSDIRISGRFFEPYTIMDIHREKDGCQATVIISADMMQMLVWNEKHLKGINRI